MAWRLSLTAALVPWRSRMPFAPPATRSINRLTVTSRMPWIRRKVPRAGRTVCQKNCGSGSNRKSNYWAKRRKLRAGRKDGGAVATSQLAFVFPGQGSQYVGMGQELSVQFAVAKEAFAEADDALGFFLSKVCFSGPEADLKLTENTQPAILTNRKSTRLNSSHITISYAVFC